MGLLEDIEAVAGKFDKRLDAIEGLLRRILQDGGAPGVAGLIGAGLAMFGALASQVEILFVEVTSAAGITAKRLMVDQTSGLWVDDDEDAASFVVQAGAGAAPFLGARCYALRVAEFNNFPVYHLIAGECIGFKAKITSAADANETHQWSQVNTPSGLTALSHASAGLDRALDRTSLAYDPDVTPRSERGAVPLNTVVEMHWNPVDTRMEFVLGPEPLSEPC